MKNTIYNYVSYFRRLAAEHHAILHDPQQETQAATIRGARRFVLFDTDEVVTGLRTQIGDGIVLFLEAYTFQGHDNDAGDYRSQHQGRFIVAKKYNVKSFYDLVYAYDECEKVTWDFINRLIFDSSVDGTACGTPFKNLSLANFSCDPVDKLWDNRAGWLVEFRFEQSRIDAINADNATDTNIWQLYTPPYPTDLPPLETDFTQPAP